MTNIGILGLASFYGPAYAERVTQRPDTSIIAASTAGVDDEDLTALGRPTADEAAEQFACPVYDTVEPVLSEADAVVVATATSRRPTDAVQALEHGCPVLSAKPIASDADGACRVARAAAETGTPVVFTTPARYDDAIAGVWRRVRAGSIGEVQAVRAMIRHDRVPEAGIHANAEHAPGEAGSTHAMAVYTADLLLWLITGDPTRVTAEYTNINTPHSKHPDLGTATTQFNDGALGTMTMTYSTDCRETWGNWEVEVVGSDGILRTAHDGYEGIHWSAGAPDERNATVFGRTKSSVLDRTLEAFLNTIPGTRPDRTPNADEIAATHALCDAWEQASNKTQSLDLAAWPSWP